MKSKSVGFTITELLVVVTVIGILAAVVLPKFTKTLENYKTAEAEHMLEAIRNEQEARCELDGSYTADPRELGTWATDTSKYFNYSLQACGMSATRLGGEGYMLQIPLYEDGRICCEGCDTLNKDYLPCDELRASLPTSCPCAAEGGTPPTPTPEPCQQTPKPDTSCGCNNTGHYSATWNSESCSWDIGTTCIGEDTSGCCVKTEKPTSPGCGCKDTGHFEYTWDANKCAWKQGSECVDEDSSQCPNYEFTTEVDWGWIGYQAQWNGNKAVWERAEGSELYIPKDHRSAAGIVLGLPKGFVQNGFACRNPTKPRTITYTYDGVIEGFHPCPNCHVGTVYGDFTITDMASEHFCSEYGGAAEMCKTCPSDQETCDRRCVYRWISSEEELVSSSPEIRPYRNEVEWVNYNGDWIFSCTKCTGLSARNGNLCAGGWVESAKLYTCKLKQ